MAHVLISDICFLTTYGQEREREGESRRREREREKIADFVNAIPFVNITMHMLRGHPQTHTLQSSDNTTFTAGK